MFHGRGRVRRRLFPRLPQWIPILGFYFVLCKSPDERTSGRTHERMNERFVLASPQIYPAVPRIVPYATAREKGRLGIEFDFQQNQKLILILRDAIAALLACVVVVHPPFCVRACARTIAHNNEQGGNTSEHLSHCIRVRRPGFPWRDISSRRDCLLGPRARSISSVRDQEGSAEIVGL